MRGCTLHREPFDHRLYAWDTAYFSTTQGGPGGAYALGMGPIGPGSVSSAAQNPPAASPGASVTSGVGFRIHPAIWIFVLLTLGYWGLHQSLKAV